MILEIIPVGQMQVNCYVIATGDNNDAIIIDPGDDQDKIKKALNKHKLKASFIINTHGHFDHIGADDLFNVPVYVHNKDLLLLKDPALNLSAFFDLPISVKSEIRGLEDKEVIDLSGISLEIIHVPGHTPGGMAILLKGGKNDIVFTGDTLFCLSVGRSDFPGANGDLLVKSIKDRLLILKDDTIVYPGHGPSSSIGKERANNPFLKE